MLGCLPERFHMAWFLIFFALYVTAYVRYWPIQRARILKAREKDGE